MSTCTIYNSYNYACLTADGYTHIPIHTNAAVLPASSHDVSYTPQHLRKLTWYPNYQQKNKLVYTAMYTWNNKYTCTYSKVHL